MFRWLEQVEAKHFEFIRTRNSFAYSATSWRALANKYDDFSGHRAFALKQSRVYLTLVHDTIAAFEESAFSDICGKGTDFAKLTHADLVLCVTTHRKRILETLLISQ